MCASELISASGYTWSLCEDDDRRCFSRVGGVWRLLDCGHGHRRPALMDAAVWRDDARLLRVHRVPRPRAGPYPGPGCRARVLRWYRGAMVALVALARALRGLDRPSSSGGGAGGVTPGTRDGPCTRPLRVARVAVAGVAARADDRGAAAAARGWRIASRLGPVAHRTGDGLGGWRMERDARRDRRGHHGKRRGARPRRRIEPPWSASRSRSGT